MRFLDLAATSAAVTATSGRRAKIELLAAQDSGDTFNGNVDRAAVQESANVDQYDDPDVLVREQQQIGVEIADIPVVPYPG